MEQFAGRKSANQFLYPPIEPFDQRTIDTGDGHRLYVEQCGNPSGMPVVVLHGGPGGGCSPSMRRYFDPAAYRIILFDQRGCGRSRPHASVENNTTWHLVSDIEQIRQDLGIDRWMVFGGSWGATLALVYAISHPDQVGYLALRGVFLMTKRELDWFYAGGAGQFWPDVWDRFVQLIPPDERDDMIKAYNKRLFSGDSIIEVRYARAWAAWENALASIDSIGSHHESPAEYARAFSRLENHYFINNGFLESDDWIRDHLDRIAHIPGTVVQGRYDMICPPHSAWSLTQSWPASELRLIPHSGHALSEPGISGELVRVTNSLRRQRKALNI